MKIETTHFDGVLVISAHVNGLQIGKAKVSKREDHWFLADITVCDFKNVSFIRKLLSFGKLKNYQKQGVGSSLLTTLISEAKMFGIPSICGQITGYEMEMLRRWYSKFGFSIDDHDNIALVLNQV